MYKPRLNPRHNVPHWSSLLGFRFGCSQGSAESFVVPVQVCGRTSDPVGVFFCVFQHGKTWTNHGKSIKHDWNMGIYDDLWWCKWGFMMMFVGRWWFLLYEPIDVHDIPIMISLLYRVSWNRDTHFTSKSWMTILVLTPVTRRYPSRNLQLGIWNLNWQTIMIYPLVMSKSLLKVAMEIVYLLINSMVDFSIFFCKRLSEAISH